MTTLGEILSRLDDPTEIQQMLADIGDVQLIAQVQAAAAGDPCAFALSAIDHFSRAADSEAWTKLIGRVQDAQAPAQACLGEMLRWAVSH